MYAALPFLVRRSKDNNGIGTAFLASRGDTVRLITCAHTAEGTQPTLNFNNWPRNFDIRVGGQWVNLPFFSNGDPAFTYRVREEDGRMADMISPTLPADVLQVLQREFKVFNLDKAFTCTPGQKLVAYGYPDVGEKEWPPVMQRSKGKAIDDLVHANIPTQLGFSGGPVVAHGANLAGMLLGTNDNKQTVVMKASVLALLFD